MADADGMRASRHGIRFLAQLRDLRDGKNAAMHLKAMFCESVVHFFAAQPRAFPLSWKGI